MFCPLIKEECKGDKCVMWFKKEEGEGECLIPLYLDMHSDYLFHILEEYDAQVQAREESKSKVVESATPEELAKELVSFFKEQYPEEQWVDYKSGVFWESKGVIRDSLPPDLRLKVQKAERLAQEEIDKEWKEEIKERLEKESADLPSLVISCIDWAKSKGLTNLAKMEIETFLSEKNLDLLPQTQKILKTQVNFGLKHGH
jgi:hypothetical protein